MSGGLMGSNKQYDPLEYDPLMDKSAQKARKFIYGQAGDTYDRSKAGADAYISALQGAYNDPSWDKSAAMTSAVLDGSYTNQSPRQVDQAIALLNRSATGKNLKLGAPVKNGLYAIQRQGEAQIGDQNLQFDSQAARGNNAFSTGTQNIRQAANNSIRSGALDSTLGQYAGAYQNERGMMNNAISNQSNIRLDNYNRERAYQNQAPQQVYGLTGGRAGLLGEAANTAFTPLQGYNGLLSLSKGGQYVNPDIIKNPGLLDYGIQILGSSIKLASSISY